MSSRIRIIGGQWKRRLLPVPDAPSLRPTPDRVRETLFNWLGQDLSGWRCLDLFAGSGALGVEAASRGARQVLMVEQNAAIVRGLQASVRQLGAEQIIDVIRADATRWLDQRPPMLQDLILLDPPFRCGWLPRILPAVLPWLAPDGVVYVESDFMLTDDWLRQTGCAALGIIRAGRAGQVHYQLLQHNGQEAPA